VSADDIRLAWNLVTERISAVHPDDGTFPAREAGFAPATLTRAELLELGALAPGGPRLIIGPTLAEVIRAFEHPEEPQEGSRAQDVL
jgi:hypothetical protein